MVDPSATLFALCSNITEAIDLAFVDRADIKAYIGNPNLQARCMSCARLRMRTCCTFVVTNVLRDQKFSKCS